MAARVFENWNFLDTSKRLWSFYLRVDSRKSENKKSKALLWGRATCAGCLISSITALRVPFQGLKVSGLTIKSQESGEGTWINAKVTQFLMFIRNLATRDTPCQMKVYEYLGQLK